MRQSPLTLAEIGMISGTRFVIGTGLTTARRQSGSQDAPAGEYQFASSWNPVFHSDAMVASEQAANRSRAEPANPGKPRCLVP